MTIKKIWGSRVQADGHTFIADDGLIFYDENDGELRIGDGVTPGGLAIRVRADLITAQSLLPEEDNVEDYDLGSPTRRWHHLFIGDGGIKFNGESYPDEQTVPWIPGAQVDNIIPALDNGVNLGDTDKRFANLYLGYDGLFLADSTTDANINITVDNGTLFIDGAENLRLGNLAIRDTTLTSANPTLDISIGDTDDTGFFYIKRKAQIDNTSFGATEAMFSINASGGGEPLTNFPDTLVQATGRPNKNSRIVQRAYGSTGETGGLNSYAVWSSYAARGTVTAPVALKAGDILSRLSSNGYGGTTFGAGGTRIESVAMENFTDTAKGSRINFWTTPVGQITPQNVASINAVGVVVTGIQFAGDETVQTTAGIPLTALGNEDATQVATLGIDGKLDAAQIPSALTGAIIFKGVWNAATNTPTLSDDLPEGVAAGWQFVVEVGGTRDIGDGSKVFVSGDFVIYDGTHWKQVPSGNLFTSLTGGGGITVSQSTGAITLGSTATPLSNVSTIVSRDSSGNFAANVITASLTGTVTGSVSGNAGSVTNGVYTTGAQSIGGVKTFTSTIVGSINGNAGTVTNGVYTTGVGVVTNTMLANSTISGIALGSNLAALTISTYLTGTSYNGSTATTIAVDATTAATASKVVARDANAHIAAVNYTGLVTHSIREAGTVSGGTVTLNMTTDDIVRCTFANAGMTVAFSNIIPGRTVTLLARKTDGGADTIDTGITAQNMSTGDETVSVDGVSTVVLTYYSLGTTTADIYCSMDYRP